jgi:isopentenyl-diphosphate delta-isomerase
VSDEVVLLDETGRAVGTLSKSAVHTRDTPLHLAFSCYVFNERGEFLLTRRALGKLTWPGVWTNSCCGHPLPGEDLTASVARRLRDELGTAPVRTDLVLPAFRYQARMDNGVLENEMCPVLRAVTADPPAPAAAEVADTMWVPWLQFTAKVREGRAVVSPWCALQVGELITVGADPLAWAAAPADALPPAARL